MRGLLILLLGLVLASSAAAQPAEPSLVARWEGNRLHVTWSAPEPGCLVLEGNLPNQRLADIPCAQAGDVWLPTGGVDYAHAPHKRTSVALRAQVDLTRVLASAPTWRLVLPLGVR